MVLSNNECGTYLGVGSLSILALGYSDSPDSPKILRW